MKKPFLLILLCYSLWGATVHHNFTAAGGGNTGSGCFEYDDSQNGGAINQGDLTYFTFTISGPDVTGSPATFNLGNVSFFNGDAAPGFTTDFNFTADNGTDTIGALAPYTAELNPPSGVTITFTPGATTAGGCSGVSANAPFSPLALGLLFGSLGLVGFFGRRFVK
jgi:hypothetical protein